MDYPRAESLYAVATSRLESGRVSTERLPEVYARLAGVQLRLCSFAAARSTYEWALLYAITQRGGEPLAVAGILNGLGRLEFLRGDLGRAERLYLRALRLAEAGGGPEHPRAAEVLRSLAELERAERRFNEGEEHARRALDIQVKNHEVTAEELALTYAALAFNMRGWGGYNAADQLFGTALAVATRAYGENHPVCAAIHNHIAGLAVNLIDGNKGQIHGDKALAIIERTLGPDHLEAGYIHANLGRAYIYLEQFDRAMAHYRRSEEILVRHLGIDHPDVAGTIGWIAHLYRFMKRPAEAMREAERMFAIAHSRFTRASLQLEDRSAYDFTMVLYYAMSGYAAAHFEHPNPGAAATRRLAEMVIAYQGIASDNTYFGNQFLRAQDDDSMRRLGAHLADVRAERAAVHYRDPMGMDATVRRMQDSLTRVEQDLLAELAERRLAAGDSAYWTVNLDSVCAAIPDGACFVNQFGYWYMLTNTKVYGEQSRFAAFILDRKGLRGFTHLANADSTHYQVNRLSTLLQQRSRQASWDAPSWQEFDSLSLAYTTQTWSPIERFVRPNEMVLLCPDLYASLLPAGMLRDSSGYLIEDHTFQYIPAARNLLRFRRESMVGSGLFALGNPDFDALPEERLAVLDNQEASPLTGEPVEYAVRNIRPFCERLDSLHLPPLPNTEREIQRSAQRWSEQRGGPARTLVQAAANEEQFKRLAHGNRVLHLATHGYFVEHDCRGPILSASGGYQFGPLLYSGLLLAGANLNGKGADEAGAEDGILTSQEVAATDLRGTNLVLLSACESATGEPANGQGLYGLARAFELAGARQVVSALWPVTDAASMELMDRIFSQPDRRIADILRDYARDQIEKDRQAGRPTDPFLWAPYVAYGDWRAR
ncbi:MAG TPA: CHAT domain-containing tetratricopeptide repeat protein [bacterium]|nr:CHAT domain-containing tetratricopeptide repeat protein [bacterium]